VGRDSPSVAQRYASTVAVLPGTKKIKITRHSTGEESDMHAARRGAQAGLTPSSRGQLRRHVTLVCGAEPSPLSVHTRKRTGTKLQQRLYLEPEDTPNHRHRDDLSSEPHRKKPDSSHRQPFARQLESPYPLRRETEVTAPQIRREPLEPHAPYRSGRMHRSSESHIKLER